MVNDCGDCGLSVIDDGNIPVNIFIHKPDEDNGNKWNMTADNFMPRRMVASEGAYSVVADTREELQEVIKKHILPIYATAFELVKGMTEGKYSSLYYWIKPIDKQ